jgi:hypothetical protein
MRTERKWEIRRRSLTGLTFSLAMAFTGVAGATAVSAPASGTKFVSANVTTLHFSGGKTPQRNKACKWCAWTGSAFGTTNTLARAGAPAQRTLPPRIASTSFTLPSPTTPSLSSDSIADSTDVSGIPAADIAIVSTNNVGPVRFVGTGISALESGMKWRSSSFNIAGSRVWSTIIKFSSTGINIRLPLN